MSSQPLSGQRVLVTGASGFLGSHVSRRLAAAGAVVYGVSRTPREQRGPIIWATADLTDPQQVRRVFDDVQPGIVYHLSGAVTGATALDMVEPVFRSLLASTVNVLVSAAACGRPRVVLAASLEEPRTLDGVPASSYAIAKAAAGAYGRMFNALYGVPVVLVRPFMTYGPAQPVSKVVPHVITSLLAGTAPRLGSGRRPVDWVYVDDVTDGMIAAATHAGIEGETVDLGSGALVTVRDVVETIVDLMAPDVQPVFDPGADRPVEVTRVADLEQAKRLMGWEPVTGLREGLARTIEWYRAQRVAGR